MADIQAGNEVAITVKSPVTQAGMRITLKDVTFSVPARDNKKELAFLLKDVSGFFEPFQMAALMGPSGSGKTTLLDILAGRKNTGKTEGSIMFAGQKPTQQFLRRYTGYVEQFDTLLDILTVEEMLLYTAELKRPTSEPLESKKAAVEELLHKLGLDVCRKVIIGNPMTKGISGGQAKRTNIGIALITNPRVLFLDEPTSGLDSYTANEVMSVVKALAHEGTTICATIHSPSSFTFNLFDKLMMLVRGRVVYFGEQDETALSYFHNSCPNIKEMTTGYNEAEWLVDLITEADRKGKGNLIADHWANSDLKKKHDDELDRYMKDVETIPESVQKELAVNHETVTPVWWAMLVLLRYRTTRNYRNPEFLGPRIADKIIFSLLMFTLYWGIGDNKSQKNIINQAAVLFMTVTLPAFGAAAYVPAIVLERRLFLRERQDGLYRTITYLLAKITEELILACLVTLVMTAASFHAISLQGEWVVYWLANFTTLCIGIVLAYFISALSPNMDVANAALPTYVVTLLFFAGFLMRFADMPAYWKWYSYIDFLRYGWGALMVNQFKDSTAIYLQNKTVLQVYSLHHVNKWSYVGYQWIFFFVFFTGAWAALQFKRHQKR